MKQYRHATNKDAHEDIQDLGILSPFLASPSSSQDFGTPGYQNVTTLQTLSLCKVIIRSGLEAKDGMKWDEIRGRWRREDQRLREDDMTCRWRVTYHRHFYRSALREVRSGDSFAA
jgi:hypothetical protein